MNESQDTYEWKQDIDDALCMLHERIFTLERKIKQLEENKALDDQNKAKALRKK